MKKTSYWKRFTHTHTHSVYIQENISPARDAFIVCCLQFVVVQQGVIWPIEASSPKVVCWQDWLCDLDVALASLHSFGGAGGESGHGVSLEISDSASFRGQYLSILEESFFDPKRPHRRLLSEPEHVMCVFFIVWTANHSWALGELSCVFHPTPVPNWVAHLQRALWIQAEIRSSATARLYPVACRCSWPAWTLGVKPEAFSSWETSQLLFAQAGVTISLWRRS